ncbi:MAG: hypothetical protein GQ574_24610 [Crocinitomix sp.]|nr:hypothetical protein [Crocinitomix sp.]
MKLTNLIMGCLLLISFSTFAHPSKDQVISRLKKSNPQIFKVTCSSPEKRFEEGINKWYFGTTCHIRTEYPGVTRIYRGNERYIGKSYEKSLLGNSYYEGIPNPNVNDFTPIIADHFFQLLGSEFNYIVGTELPKYELVEGQEFLWGNLNYVTGQFELIYYKRNKDVDNGGVMTLQTIRKVIEISFSRSEDGLKYDPKEKLLLNGKWINDPNKHLGGKTISTEVINKKPITQEEYDGYRYIKDILLEESVKEYLATLPAVEIPTFNSENHVIQYVHELMIEGDKKKIEAVLYHMTPSYYYDIEASKVMNQNGIEFHEKIITDAEMYTEYFCQHPQIKSSQAGQISFYTRDLSSYGRIQVFQAKDLTWRIHTVEYPASKGDWLTKSQAAGDSNCGEAIAVSAPVAVVKYKTGDRVKGKYKGEWYDGTVSSIDPVMDDRYFVKFDNINGQWLTADAMEKGGPKSETETSSGEETKKDKKSKVNLSGLKNRIKIP